MTDISLCLYFECCPFKTFKPEKYVCNGKGLVTHTSSLDGKEMIIHCDDYVNGESAFWRTDQMIPEHIEERIKSLREKHGL